MNIQPYYLIITDMYLFSYVLSGEIHVAARPTITELGPVITSPILRVQWDTRERTVYCIVSGRK
jgi:hypothetical protein